MNDIKFYVRTTGDRKFNYNIPCEVVIDTERKPVDSFIELLERTSDEQAVILEDDLVLCDNFVEEITKVIEQYPNDIINFFTRPDRYFTTSYDTIFSFNQCTYYPKGVGKELAIEIRKLKPSFRRNMYRCYARFCIKYSWYQTS